MHLSRQWVGRSSDEKRRQLISRAGPKARAPLGAKTTNAKTKAFQTPIVPAKRELATTKKNSISAQISKPKPKTSETTKLEVLGDVEEDDVPDIEYMPPRPKSMPPPLNTQDFLLTHCRSPRPPRRSRRTRPLHVLQPQHLRRRRPNHSQRTRSRRPLPSRPRTHPRIQAMVSRAATHRSKIDSRRQQQPHPLPAHSRMFR